MEDNTERFTGSRELPSAAVEYLKTKITEAGNNDSLYAKSLRLSKKGRIEAGRIYEEFLQMTGNSNEGLRSAVKAVNDQLAEETGRIKSEIAFQISREKRLPDWIYPKGLFAELARRINQDTRVRQIRLQKKVLLSLDMRARMAIDKQDIERLKLFVTEEEITGREQSLGKTFNNSKVFLRNAIALTKLKEKREEKRRAETQEETVRLALLQERINERINKKRSSLFEKLQSCGIRLEVFVAGTLKAVKNKPLYTFLVSACIASSLYLLSGGRMPDMIALFSELTRMMKTKIETRVTDPVPATTGMERMLDVVVDMALDQTSLVSSKEGIAQPLAEKTQPISMVNAGELNLAKAIAHSTTEYPGIENARKMIVPTVEEIKRLAREGNLYYRNNHPIVIVEAEFLKHWASQPKEMREKLLYLYAEGIVGGLVESYGVDKDVVVLLEAGHMSVSPEGLRTQDTGTAAPLSEGGIVKENEVNLRLSQIIAKMITHRYPNWQVVLNSDEKGIPISSSVATFEKNEFDIRCLDTLMGQRKVCEEIAKVATEDGREVVRLSIHHNGGPKERGGELIPPAAGGRYPLN